MTATMKREGRGNRASPAMGKPISKFIMGRDPTRANGMDGPRAMTRAQWEVAQASSGRPLTDDKYMRYPSNESLESRLEHRTKGVS